MKKTISALLTIAVMISAQIIMPVSAAETRTAGEAAADVVMGNMAVVKSVLGAEINGTLNKGLGFIDIDFDGQLELWVHRTTRSDLRQAANHVYDLENGKLKEIIAFDDVIPDGGLDSGNLSTNPFGVLDLYKDSEGHTFYYADSYCGGGIPKEEAVTWYSMITNENGSTVEKPKFAYVEGEGSPDGKIKHTSYSYYGEVEGQYDVSKRDEFKRVMSAYLSGLTDLNLKTKFSEQHGKDFLSMSEKDQRKFLIESYEAFGYDGFTRNDENLGTGFQSDPQRPGGTTPDTDTQQRTPIQKPRSSDTEIPSLHPDTDTEIPKTDGKHRWNIWPWDYGDEIGMISYVQPSQKNGDGTWDIYTIGNMCAGPYMAVKDNGKYGLISYSGEIVVYPQFDQIAAGYGGVLVGIDDRTGKKTVLKENNGHFTLSNYDGELGSGREGTYYWVMTEKTLYKVSSDGTAEKSDDNRTMIVDVGEKKKDGTVVPYQSSSDNNVNAKAFVSGGKALESVKNIGFISDAGSYSDGLIPVMNTSKKWGYCDKDGNVVIPFEYDAAWNSVSSGEYSTFGSDGRAYDASNGYVVLKKDGKYALFTTDGRIEIDFGEYDEILPVYSDGTTKYVWVKTGGRWGNLIISGGTGTSASTDTSTNSDSTDTSTDKKPKFGGTDSESSDTDTAADDTDNSSDTDKKGPDNYKDRGTKNTMDAPGGGRRTEKSILPYVLIGVGSLVVAGGIALGLFVLLRKKN